MSSTQNYEPEYDASDDEEMAAFLCASHLAAGFAMPMTLKAVIELGVLDIIANSVPGRQLSPAEIVSEIETENPTAPVVLDRLLRYLASGSVLTCSVAEGDGGRPERRYGLGPVCKFFISRADGASLAPFILMNQAKIHQACWQELKYAVIDGVTPFQKIAGMNQFDYLQRDPELRKIFNDAMSGGSVISLRMILGSYTGFQSIGTLVDVGGGTGTALQTIISKFPTIKGINFDLPHIISDAPSIPDLLIRIAMEKDSLYSELIKVQLILCYQCQQNSNRRVFYNRENYVFKDWERKGHDHVCIEPPELLWISSGSSNCKGFIDITHNLSLILIIISIMLGYIIITLCHCEYDF